MLNGTDARRHEETRRGAGRGRPHPAGVRYRCLIRRKVIEFAGKV